MATDKPGSIFRSIFSPDVILLVVIGLALLIFSVYRRNDAFPAASLDMKINKREALQIAQTYAKTTGFIIPKRIVSSTYFSADNEADTFLEYEYPLSVANELMRKEIPIWHWKIHLLDDDADEVQVAIGVNGSLHSFDRDLSKEKSLPSVSHEIAKNKVIVLAAQELQIPLTDWKMISDEESTLPKRTDHSFIWEDESKDYKGAHLRLSATVSGDKISQFAYYLHVPDAFTKKFKWLRAQNRALANIPYFFVLLFALSLPVVFLRSWTRGRLRVKFAIVSGLIGATVSLISSLNSTATIIVGTSNWSMETFLAKHFINDVISALITGLVCTIFFGAIETVYRNWFTKQVAFELLLGQGAKAFRSISIAKSTVLGTAIFGITTGYQVIFFLIGKHYGLWAPLAINDRSVINSFCPAWDAISVGIKASTLEELGFRIFMLIIFQRVTKSFWLANLLQAALWGFGHCTYAVEPPYARGVELGVLGILYGWVMRRYGVLSLIIGHYAFDVYLSVQTLFGSHDVIDLVSAFIALAPLAALPIVAIALIFKSGQVTDDEVSNETITSNLIAPSTSGVEQELWPVYKPISNQNILIALSVAVLAATTFAIPKKRLGDEPVMRIDHAGAIALTRNYFAKENFNTSNLQATAWMSDDTDTEQIQYVSTHTSAAQTKMLEQLIEPRLVWNVRLFKPGDANVFYLRIGPDGSPVTSTISIDEMASGAKLTQEQATDLATKYLATIESPDGSPFTIFDSSKLEHPNRTDYTFIAENPSANAGGARFQIYLKVIGDNISSVRKYWSLPDESRARTTRGHTTVNDIVILLARLICALVVLPNLGYWMFCACKKQTPNKFVVSAAVLIVGALVLLEQANYLSRVAFWGYNPTEPVDTHLLELALSCLTRVSVEVAAVTVLAAIVSSSYTGLFITCKFRELCRNAKPQIGNYRIWTDGILIGLTAAILIAGFSNFNEYAVSMLSTSVSLTRLKQVAWLEQTNLTMVSVLEAIKYGVFSLLIGAAIMRWSDFYTNQRANSTVKKEHKGYALMVPVLIGMTICTTYLSASDAPKMFSNVGTLLSLATSLYLVLVILGNGNLTACFFAAIFLIVGKDAYEVHKHLAIIHPIDQMCLIGVLLIPILWLALGLVLTTIKKKPAD